MSISTLGIIGSGQLGSLLCQAAKKLDVKTVVISDDKDGPAQNYSDEFIYSKYDFFHSIQILNDFWQGEHEWFRNDLQILDCLNQAV